MLVDIFGSVFILEVMLVISVFLCKGGNVHNGPIAEIFNITFLFSS